MRESVDKSAGEAPPGAPAEGRDGPAAPPDPGGPAAGAPKKASSWFEPRKQPQSGPEESTPPDGVPAAGEQPAPSRGGSVPPLPVREPGGTGAPPAPAPPASAPPASAPRPPAPGAGVDDTMALRTGGFPSGPTTGPVAGDMPLPPPRAEDDPAMTMNLGVAMPGGPSSPRTPGYGREADGAMPAMPEPYGMRPTASAPGPHPPRAASDPPGSGGGYDDHAYDDDYGDYDDEPRPAGRGRLRSRLTLAVLAVGGIFVLAYGAGLLLNQDDVPQGTTVLGHDIGGTTAQEAVNRLDAAFADSADADLVLLAEGEELTLKPSVAGLAIDTEATVREAGGTEYNPVAVIGSLFGGAQEVDPVFTVDEEKLTAALSDISSGLGGQPRDGSIEILEGGSIETDFGTPGTAIDAEAAAAIVKVAYRIRAGSGTNPPIEVPVTSVEPEIGQAEVEAMMEEFAEPAMSGLVTVVAETGSAAPPLIQFSPENSLWRFVSVKQVDGALVDHYDLDALAGLYGSTFDGVQIERADGFSPVTPQDVALALRDALRQTDPEQRYASIDLNPR